MEEFTSIKDILEKTGKYTGLTTGTSMRPIIHQHRDNIIVVKPTGRLKKYDVPVFQTKDGKYIMHRIIEVYDDHYITMGDNRRDREYVTDDMICGVLVGYFRKGKKYVDCQKTKWYKIYSRVWVALMPLRPISMFINRCLDIIDRHILKRY